MDCQDEKKNINNQCNNVWKTYCCDCIYWVREGNTTDGYCLYYEKNTHFHEKGICRVPYELERNR